MREYKPSEQSTKEIDRKRLRGFTIVELLIVVVIAILAAITIVAYNGITAQAKESALKSDLATAAKKPNLEKVETGSFPGTYTATGPTYTGGGSAFCITGAANGKEFHIKETGTVEQGGCAAPVATTMQTFTQSHCSALDTFTGSNISSVVSLTDSRGGTTRTYEVAKLADGKCWMLTNLKLGSATDSITLTPTDSNVAGNFTLPQLTTGGSLEYDLPRSYGPVPGDTGSGATNYGYLYNFPAATAGETRTSLTTGGAQYSICPANWRLPTAGYNNDSSATVGDYPDLNRTFGGADNYAGNDEANIAKWQPSGSFRGSFSGAWDASFDDQGAAGYLWSSVIHPGGADAAFFVSFQSGAVSPGDGSVNRYVGLGVRCILN